MQHCAAADVSFVLPALQYTYLTAVYCLT